MTGSKKKWMVSMSLFAWVLATSACDLDGPADAQSRLRILGAEGEALNRAADVLEARLLSTQGNVRHWGDLAERRRSVSEVACRVSEAHAEEMEHSALFVRPRPQVLAQIQGDPQAN